MSKYIIDIEDEPVNGLYKAKNFRTLVFDAEGLRRLKRVENADVGTYYYVNEHFTVSQGIDTDSEEDAIRKEIGNYFKSFSTAFDACEKLSDFLDRERGN